MVDAVYPHTCTPLALRLADLLDSAPYSSPLTNDAAEELRRLDAVNAELLDALQTLLNWVPVYPKGADGIVGGREAHKAAIEKARAAIAKAGGEA